MNPTEGLRPTQIVKRPQWEKTNSPYFNDGALRLELDGEIWFCFQAKDGKWTFQLYDPIKDLPDTPKGYFETRQDALDDFYQSYVMETMKRLSDKAIWKLMEE